MPRVNKREHLKTWNKTRIQGLYKHRNGRYYTRTFGGKKEKWHAHKTADYDVAKLKHEKYMADLRKQRAIHGQFEAAALTFGEAEAIYMSRVDASPTQKESSKKHKRQVLKSLKRDWPELDATPLRNITLRDFLEWSKKHAARASATRYNTAIGLLKGIMDVGIESHALSANPARMLKRLPVRVKKPELPSRDKFLQMVEKIRTAKGRFSRPAADFVEGLAYTGMRLREAGSLRWQDVDLEKKRIHVRGDPATGTKNWETRYVPMIPDAYDLFSRLKETHREKEPSSTSPVFLVRESQKAINRAAELVGIPRITHHDLRDLFATSCIESGVDIPTVSRWLGHKDGGALLMKVYGHLRDEHSTAAAQKVSFAPRQVIAPPPTPEP